MGDVKVEAQPPLQQQAPTMYEPGPVHISRGKVIGKRWKVRSKLGEGGCGAVYKVEDLENPGELAAMKAESNFVAGGSVLKLEAMILRRMAGKRHVAQLLYSGKKTNYCYMVMTLMGDSLSTVVKKCGRIVGVSTQTRVAINVLYGLKQIHDIGFVHRDLKPANIALGRQGTKASHFLHILDFGLAREYVVKDEEDEGKLKMRRPRPKALFRGTTRYCSIVSHERLEQGRVDDLWSLLYMLAEMRSPLPWSATKDKKEVAKMKRAIEMDKLLENSPVELMRFAQNLNKLNYYSRPDYAYLLKLLMNIMEAGNFKFTDQYDWEKKGFVLSKETEKSMVFLFLFLLCFGLNIRKGVHSKLFVEFVTVCHEERIVVVESGILARVETVPSSESISDRLVTVPKETIDFGPIGYGSEGDN